MKKAKTGNTKKTVLERDFSSFTCEISPKALQYDWRCFTKKLTAFFGVQIRF